jgi:hypothetical protein
MKLMENTSKWLAGANLNSILTSLEPSNSSSSSPTSPAPYSLSDIIAYGKRYLELSDVDTAWDTLGEKAGVKVWKMKKDAMRFGSSDDRRWPCVKSSTIIDADPKTVLNFLMDSSQVKKYNQYSIGREDVEQLSKNTKIVWNKTRIPFSIKSFDFCTLMHHYEHHGRDRDGKKTNDIIIVSKHIEHALVPLHKNFIRCENIIGLQVLRPIHNHQTHKVQTEIVSISHVRNPIAHPILITANAFHGTFKYLDQLRKTVSRTPPKHDTSTSDHSIALARRDQHVAL